MHGQSGLGLGLLVGAMMMCVLALLGCASGGSAGGRGASSAGNGGSAMKPADSAIKSLMGEWELKQLGGGDLASLLPAGARAPSLNFLQDGKVSGFAGVNRLTSQLDISKLAAGEFSLAPAATTRMAGPPELMNIENQFTTLLGRANQFKLDDNRLTLLDGGQEILGFVKR